MHKSVVKSVTQNFDRNHFLNQLQLATSKARRILNVTVIKNSAQAPLVKLHGYAGGCRGLCRVEFPNTGAALAGLLISRLRLHLRLV